MWAYILSQICIFIFVLEAKRKIQEVFYCQSFQ